MILFFLSAYDGEQISGILHLFVVPKALKGHVKVPAPVPFGVYGGMAAECADITSVMSLLMCRNKRHCIFPHFQEGCDATYQVQSHVERSGTRHAS